MLQPKSFWSKKLAFWFFLHCLLFPLQTHSKPSSLQEPATLQPGFMYWYGTHPLLQQFTGILSGVVEEVDPQAGAPTSQHLQGRIQVKEVLFWQPLASRQTPPTSIVTQGFEGLEPGDLVVVLFVEYEGAHAIPDYGKPCHLGVRVSSFSDPVVKALRNYQPEHVWSATELTAWARHFPLGVADYKERRRFLKEMRPPKGSLEAP